MNSVCAERHIEIACASNNELLNAKKPHRRGHANRKPFEHLSDQQQLISVRRPQDFGRGRRDTPNGCDASGFSRRLTTWTSPRQKCPHVERTVQMSLKCPILSTLREVNNCAPTITAGVTLGYQSAQIWSQICRIFLPERKGSRTHGSRITNRMEILANVLGRTAAALRRRRATRRSTSHLESQRSISSMNGSLRI